MSVKRGRSGDQVTAGQTIAIALAVIAIGMLVGLGVVCVIWHAYMFVAGYFFPTAPANILHPNFWVFYVTWVVGMFILRQIGSSK